jgi:hypothetical protein
VQQRVQSFRFKPNFTPGLVSLSGNISRQEFQEEKDAGTVLCVTGSDTVSALYYKGIPPYSNPLSSSCTQLERTKQTH